MLRRNEVMASDVFIKSDIRSIIAGLIFSAQQLGRPDEITKAYVAGIMAVAKSLGISISPSEIDFNGG